jgi:hypothetical protein
MVELRSTKMFLASGHDHRNLTCTSFLMSMAMTLKIIVASGDERKFLQPKKHVNLASKENLILPKRVVVKCNVQHNVTPTYLRCHLDLKSG